MKGFRQRRTGAILAITMLLGSASCALAANPQDKSFIQSALQDNVDIRTLSDLAQKKIQDAKIRAFARTVSRQSSPVDDRLMRNARTEDVKPPGTLSLRASDQYGRLQSQNGKDAADEYLRDVAIDARISEDDYTSEVQSGGDPSLKRLASERVRQLEELARTADSLRDSLR